MNGDVNVDRGYILALKHAIDRLEINFLADVDNDVTLQEFKDWLEEKENG